MKPSNNNFFEPNIYIGNGQRVEIGSGCQINESVFIQGAKIGNNVLIAPYVTILSKNHEHSDSSIPIIYQGESDELIPTIGDGTWLGRNVIVMPGIKIGAHSIVGAGAVVTKDVLAYSIVGGVPAKLIRMRT